MATSIFLTLVLYSAGIQYGVIGLVAAFALTILIAKRESEGLSPKWFWRLTVFSLFAGGAAYFTEEPILAGLRIIYEIHEDYLPRLWEYIEMEYGILAKTLVIAVFVWTSSFVLMGVFLVAATVIDEQFISIASAPNQAYSGLRPDAYESGKDTYEYYDSTGYESSSGDDAERRAWGYYSSDEREAEHAKEERAKEEYSRYLAALAQLGLEPTPGLTMADIKTAWRKMVQKHHPDKYSPLYQGRQTEILNNINTAYKIICELEVAGHDFRNNAYGRYTNSDSKSYTWDKPERDDSESDASGAYGENDNTRGSYYEESQQEDARAEEESKRNSRTEEEAKRERYLKALAQLELTLTPELTMAKIKTAWRRLAQRHHPDKYETIHQERQTEILKIINTAHDVLCELGSLDTLRADA